ncbi:MAG: response regulator [Gemmatimonadota bacterium]|nr:MAG: response regulator [Gemmatimonadota bacterium]
MLPIGEQGNTDLRRFRDALEAARHLLSERREEAVNSVRRIARGLLRLARDRRYEELSSAATRLLEGTAANVEANVSALLSELALAIEMAVPSPGSVLIIEDDPIPAKLLQARLAKSGWPTEVAGTAAKAEEIIAKRSIAAIVLDLVLPDADGRNLLLRLKEDPILHTVPVFIASARSDPHVRAECLALGAEEFLAKPVDVERLLRLVTDADRRGSAAPARAVTLAGMVDRRTLTTAFSAAKSKSRALALLVAIESSHPAAASGARTLESLATQMATALGDAALVAPWNEDKLAVLFPEANLATARRLLQAARKTLTESNAGLDFSAGVAVVAAGTPLQEAIDQAGHLLYLTQRSAGGQIVSDPREVRGRTIRVLVAEDDDVAAKLLVYRITREPGFEVVRCANGDEALASAQTEQFDLAILDVNMPGLGGFDVLTRLREMPGYAEIPIAMLTALGSERDIVRGLELGADDYIVKPFSPTELIARVRRMLGRSTRAS